MEDFDRAVRVLSDSIGFRVSRDLAKEFLEAWFDSEAYCYRGASLTNIPWMLAYFNPTRSLIGRYIHDNRDLSERIADRVPGAQITEDGRLEYRTKNFVSVTFEFIRHEIVNTRDGGLEEKMTMRVEASDDRDGAPVTIMRQTIHFDDARFSAARSGSIYGLSRIGDLLEIAQEMADQRLGEGWRDE